MTYLAANLALAHSLADDLLSASPRESGAFATLHSVSRGQHTRFQLGSRIDSGTEWETQTEAALTPSGSMVSAAVSAAQARRAGIAFIHTHPTDPRPPTLSAIDAITTRRLGAAFAELVDGPFASLIVSPGGWGGVINANEKLIPLDRICLVGRRLSLYSTVNQGQDEPLDDRQRRALGDPGNATLRDLRIGIVGVGGIGAPLAETLARMGVATLTLIDDDDLEMSNVRRVFGVTHLDAERRRPKVEAVADGLNRLMVGSEVRAIRGDIRNPTVQASLLSCDVLFSCTDTHSSRAALTELAVRGTYPLIDLGARLGVRSSGDLDALLFERRIQLPDGPCLWCWRTLDAHRIRVELMSEFERKSLIDEGYVAGPANGHEPSVAALTVAAAGAGAAALVGLVAGGLEQAPLGSSFELLRSEAFAFEREIIDPDCVCSRWRPT